MKSWIKWVFLGIIAIAVLIAISKCGEQKAKGMSSIQLMAIAAQPIKQEKCVHSDTTFSCVEYLRNYDGDTVAFNIPNIHPLLGKDIDVRLTGIDAPEIKTNDKCEKKLAERAKLTVNVMLANAKRIDLVNVKRDKYFRIDADIHVNGKSVSKHMLRYNLAYEYHGGKKPKTDWCNFNN